jgi:hypothetical protein
MTRTSTPGHGPGTAHQVLDERRHEGRAPRPDHRDSLEREPRDDEERDDRAWDDATLRRETGPGDRLHQAAQPRKLPALDLDRDRQVDRVTATGADQAEDRQETEEPDPLDEVGSTAATDRCVRRDR